MEKRKDSARNGIYEKLYFFTLFALKVFDELPFAK